MSDPGHLELRQDGDIHIVELKFKEKKAAEGMKELINKTVENSEDISLEVW